MPRKKSEEPWRPPWTKWEAGAFLGSEDLMEMTDAEFRGYVNLLNQQLASEDGYLNADEEELRKKSRIRERWPEAKRAILRKFELVGNKYSNRRARRAWEDAYNAHTNIVEGVAAANEKKRMEKEKENLGTTQVVPRNDPGTSQEPPYIYLSTLSISSVSDSLSLPVSSALSPETASPEAQGAIAESSEVLGHGGNQDETQESNTLQKLPPRANFSPIPPRQGVEDIQPVTQTTVKSLALVPPSAPQPFKQGEVSPKVREERARATREVLGWPENVDREQALIAVLRLYPLPQTGGYVKTRAVEALDRIAKEQDVGHWAALEYLRDRIMRYAELRRSHWQSAINFLDNETYRWTDEQMKGRDNDAKQTGSEYYEGLLRESEQAESDRAADGRTYAGVGPQSSAADVPALRAASGGFGHKPLVDRLR